MSRHQSVTSAILNPITSAWEGKKQLNPTAAVCLRMQTDRETSAQRFRAGKGKTLCPGLVELGKGGAVAVCLLKSRNAELSLPGEGRVV